MANDHKASPKVVAAITALGFSIGISTIVDATPNASGSVVQRAGKCEDDWVARQGKHTSGSAVSKGQAVQGKVDPTVATPVPDRRKSVYMKFIDVDERSTDSAKVRPTPTPSPSTTTTVAKSIKHSC